ncbi:MAG: hypothetical protein APG12_00955 [Candidatus Methanofastidiosum methylothiophilum]|uniref:Uncharacterized protein n=1 Tax=Candidatus Methanofastidiosum methylothiophilum TaxID=1705564 RepID=A0A150IZ01_9EURY|nr:MAG: hypothetical protein APG10_00769 [Candidatus Methanofastidiosum methylthiophilus]KYC47616.1 MAG: hypothetical protein APG11_01022 [Candidatus Methanofastidiosum methylthiophilus]KYC50233.1 MAG: hypothetical protein APG12_00955 [Candidatus Methanofastidiosum methylthiophilus]
MGNKKFKLILILLFIFIVLTLCCVNQEYNSVLENKEVF